MPKTVDELEAEIADLRAAHESAKARISELNAESRGHRLNADNARRDAEKATADLNAAQTELEAARGLGAQAEAQAAEKVKEAETKAADAAKAAEAKAAEALTAAQQRAINADLKIAAKDAGAHDIGDVLTLLDRSKIELDDAGDIKNAAALVADLKKAKAHLFGTGASSSNPTKPPPKGDPNPKSARDMTDEEYAAARRNRAWRNK